MNIDMKFRSSLVQKSQKNTEYTRILSAECEVFIWRKGNQYAVSLNQVQEIPEKDFNPEMEIAFLLDIQKRAEQIDKKWKLVDMGEHYTGKVIGQRQITFYDQHNQK